MSLLLLSVIVLCVSSVAGAQVPVLTPAESLATFERPNGALLRPGTLRYQLSLRKPNGEAVSLGTRTVVVSDSSLGGAPGWLIAESRAGTAVPTTDSVYLARGDLWPARWSATIGRAQLGASFTRDSMFGAVQGYQGRTSFALPVNAGSLLSAGMVERLVELLPLQVGYRTAATLILVDGAAPHAVAAELVVDREERIDVAGGATECWVLAVRAGALEERLWVSKQGARVVRTEQATATGLVISVLLP
ncbi:MAG: hypothetical protein ABJE47_06575 [bacterium]